MKIIEPKVELWENNNNNDAHVARCARVCYQSKGTNNENLLLSLKNNDHYSMFRHATYYYEVPFNFISQNVEKVIKEHYGHSYFDYNMKSIFFAINGQTLMELPKEILKYLKGHTVVDIDRIPIDIRRYTFNIITQISTSRELNRVSPNNIAEKSTRYVREDGVICRPHWITNSDIDKYKSNTPFKHYDKGVFYLKCCEYCFNAYNDLINKGLKKEDARGILPLDTATECVYTYTVDEWKNIIWLRYYGGTGLPHPNAAIVIGEIRNILNKLLNANI